MTLQVQTSLAWTGVAIATLFMVLASSVILYPQITESNILTALRFSSVTTALPFLLVLVAKPLAVLNVPKHLGAWAIRNNRYLWLILTISHLLHLYQIFLYYKLGNSCPFTVWAITAPLWIIMVLFTSLALFKPHSFDQLLQVNGQTKWKFWYALGCWYIWTVFTLAFGLGAAAMHIPFYNIPALILFLAGALLHGLVRWRQVVSA